MAAKVQLTGTRRRSELRDCAFDVAFRFKRVGKHIHAKEWSRFRDGQLLFDPSLPSQRVQVRHCIHTRTHTRTRTHIRICTRTRTRTRTLTLVPSPLPSTYGRASDGACVAALATGRARSRACQGDPRGK